MAEQLADKVTLVTGGSSGIGRIVGACGKACFIAADVSRDDQVESPVEQTVACYGRLDCAFNNADVFRSGPVHEMLEEDFDLVLNANLKGVWLCMKYQVKQILAQQSSAIINNASVYGLLADACAAAYCASKNSVIGLIQSVTLEVADKGVRVNSVCHRGSVRRPVRRQAHHGAAAHGPCWPAARDRRRRGLVVLGGGQLCHRAGVGGGRRAFGRADAGALISLSMAEPATILAVPLRGSRPCSDPTPALPRRSRLQLPPGTSAAPARSPLGPIPADRAAGRPPAP